VIVTRAHSRPQRARVTRHPRVRPLYNCENIGSEMGFRCNARSLIASRAACSTTRFSFSLSAFTGDEAMSPPPLAPSISTRMTETQPGSEKLSRNVRLRRMHNPLNKIILRRLAARFPRLSSGNVARIFISLSPSLCKQTGIPDRISSARSGKQCRGAFSKRGEGNSAGIGQRGTSFPRNDRREICSRACSIVRERKRDARAPRATSCRAARRNFRGNFVERSTAVNSTSITDASHRRSHACVINSFQPTRHHMALVGTQ